MVTSHSRLAYTDCFDLMDRALDDGKGVRVKFGNHGDAWSYRLRCNAARQIDRKENLHIYEEGHPLHGRSEYDRLWLRIRDIDGYWLYLEVRAINDLIVEDLSDGNNKSSGRNSRENEGEVAK